METLARSYFVVLFSGLFPTAAWPQGGLDSKLIEGAKREKRLVHWTTMTISQSKQSPTASTPILPVQRDVQIIRKQAELSSLTTWRRATNP
ncbi:MAG TPA: hypothetical protein VLU47_11865, partial [Blastocatellia bacterium]|nr:hypothetical protein [Blastocatellia bacterium]